MSNSNIFINELREKLSIIDIVGKKVKWDNKKTNISNGIYWACCPFHDEKTPSFKVDQHKGFYYCFGCHEKGDSISFVMKSEHLDFVKTIEKLAKEVGLKLPNNYERKKNFNISKTHSLILEIQELATLYFSDCLINKPSKNANLFLKNRISSKEVTKIFRLGYATENNKDLFNFLVNKGYEKEIIIKSGLCAKNSKGEIYDRFRDRIIFPIFNNNDKVVGFGGRALKSSANAKYLNSPETEVFQKGKLLFNETNCLRNIKINHDAIIVEGYMDVIALSKVGLKNCMAPLGTAVTIDQLNKIWRISKSPIFAFDGDSSGINALNRLIYLALPLISSEKTIQACILPNNQDPDDLISKFGKQSLLDLINNPKPLIEILWDDVTKDIDLKIPEKRAQLEKKLNFIITQIQENNLRRHYIDLFKQLKTELFSSYESKLGKSITIENEQKKLNKRQITLKKNFFPSEKTKKTLIVNTKQTNLIESRTQETAILLFLINHPDLIRNFINELNEVNFINSDLEKIFEFLMNLNSKKTYKTEEVIEILDTNFGQNICSKLYSTGTIKVNPLLERKVAFKEAEIGFKDVLNRKIARQYINQELKEAKDEILQKEDETLTWRIEQANKFFNQALSGKSNKENTENNKINDDLKAIKDLIKDQIWIKKKL